MKRSDNRKNSTGKLFLLIFLCLAAGILAGGYMSYDNYQKKVRADAELQLTSITELKVNQLVQYRKERLGDAQTFFKNPAFSRLVRQFFEQNNNGNAKRQLQAWLGKFTTNYSYDGLFLLDMRGVLRLSIPEQRVPIASAVQSKALEVIRSGIVAIQDFHRNENDQRIYLTILVPIADDAEPGRQVGVLLLRIDPETFLYPYIQTWPVPSRTSETLIVRREGNNVLFLNELLFQKNTALSLSIPIGNDKIAAVKAVLGEEGIVDGLDYRGEPIVASLHKVPDSPWFMVCRVDKSEIYEPLRARLWLIILLVGALVAGSGAGIGLVWRQQRNRFYQEEYELSQVLQESEVRYKFLFESLLEGYAYCKMIYTKEEPEDVILLNVNAAFQTLTGLKDVVGRRLTEVIPGFKESDPELFAMYGRVASTGKPEQLETFVPPLERWLFISVQSPSRGHFVVVFQDITKRKRAEEAIHASEIRYRRLFEAARDGVLILDGETGKITDVNPFLIEILGSTRDMFIDKTLWEIGFFKDIAASKERFLELQQKAYVRYEDLPLSTADGRVIDVEFVSNVYSANGHKVIQCNIREITDRKQKEEKILHQMEDLKRWQEATLGREGRIRALKQQVNECLIRLGEPIRYPSQASDVETPSEGL